MSAAQNADHGIKTKVETTVGILGKLDILVNNAAFQEHAESLLDISDQRFDETLKTNVYGYFQWPEPPCPI